MVGGTQTQLGSSHSFTLTNDVAARIRLRMNGSSISGWLNGAVVIGPITDTNITAAGHAAWALGARGALGHRRREHGAALAGLDAGGGWWADGGHGDGHGGGPR